MMNQCDRCSDFRPEPEKETEDLWCPDGCNFVGDRMVKRPVTYEQDFQPRLTRAEQYEVLMTHPIFTGMCPQCSASYPQNVDRIHWDCEACGWVDDSV